jgi:hypothetical protein
MFASLNRKIDSSCSTLGSLHQELLSGALSNYVSLGELPDYDEPDTQGYKQHQALLREIQLNGKLNPVALYRGGAVSLAIEGQYSDRPGFVSFTNTIEVAKHFSDRHYEIGARTVGLVSAVAPNTIKAICLADYDYDLPDQSETFGFQEYYEESEWLVSRESLRD